MFKAIKEFFTGKKPEAAPEAPYKVEATSFVAVGEPPATVIVPVTSSEVAIAMPVEGAGVVEVKAAPAKKPRAKKATSAKPAVKKPRKTK